MIKITRHFKVILLCIAAFLCYSSHASDIETAKFIPQPVTYKILGQLNENQRFFQYQEPDLDGEASFPIILAAQNFQEMDMKEKDYIRKTYENFHVITILHPTLISYASLFDILEINLNSQQLNLNNVEFYSIRKTQGTFHETFNMVAPGMPQVMEEEEGALKGEKELKFLEPSFSLSSKDEEVSETSSLSLSKESVDDFLSWLNFQYKLKLSSLVKGASFESTRNLYDLAQEITKSVKYKQRNKEIEGGNAEDFFQLSISALSCYSLQPPYDQYYYLYLPCIFTPASDSLSKGFPPEISYIVGLVPLDYFGNLDDAAVLIESSPHTSEGGRTTTSSISYTVGGGIGFFGKTATGNIDGSISIGKSTSFFSADVTVSNQSRDIFAMWDFELASQKGNLLSNSAFQPGLQALWKIKKPSEEGLGMRFALFFQTKINNPTIKHGDREFSNAPMLKRDSWSKINEVEALINKICHAPRAESVKDDFRLLLSHSNIPKHFGKNQVGFYEKNKILIKYRSHEELINCLVHSEDEKEPILVSYIKEVIQPNILPFIFTVEYPTNS